MRTRVLLSLLALCFAPLAWTDTPSTGFAASFVQTRSVPNFDTPIVSHGNMSYDKGRGFHWEITQPYHYLFEMNGKQAHEELPDGTQRDLDPDQTPWLAAVEHIFIGALSGDRSQLQTYFAVVEKPTAQGRNLTLRPKPGSIAQVIERIDVEESAPGRPQHLQIFEISGGHMDIRFTPLTNPKP